VNGTPVAMEGLRDALSAALQQPGVDRNVILQGDRSVVLEQASKS